MTLAERLAKSRDEHAKYRNAIPHMRPDRVAGKLVAVSGNADEAHNHMVAAYGARLSAETDDPGHADAAWTTDRLAGFPHYALLQFYAEQLVPVVSPDGVQAPA